MGTNLPFINRYAALSSNSLGRDEGTSTDALPAVVDVLADGLVHERGTRCTDVKHETTDDQ